MYFKWYILTGIESIDNNFQSLREKNTKLFY